MRSGSRGPRAERLARAAERLARAAERLATDAERLARAAERPVALSYLGKWLSREGCICIGHTQTVKALPRALRSVGSSAILCDSIFFVRLSSFRLLNAVQDF